MAVPTTTGPPHSPAATLQPAAPDAASGTAADAASGTTSDAASGSALDAAAMAKRIRQDIIRMAGGPEGAHAGGSLSCADLMAVLHAELLRPGDSFVLSK